MHSLKFDVVTSVETRVFRLLQIITLDPTTLPCYCLYMINKKPPKVSDLPSKVKVGWNDVYIKSVEPSFIKDNTDCYGQYLNRENKIELMKELEGDQLINTIVHEIFHAVVYHSSLNQGNGPLKDDDNEEIVVNSMTNWFIGVCRDNKWLVELLRKLS